MSWCSYAHFATCV